MKPARRCMRCVVLMLLLRTGITHHISLRRVWSRWIRFECRPGSRSEVPVTSAFPGLAPVHIPRPSGARPGPSGWSRACAGIPDIQGAPPVHVGQAKKPAGQSCISTPTLQRFPCVCFRVSVISPSPTPGRRSPRSTPAKFEYPHGKGRGICCAGDRLSLMAQFTSPTDRGPASLLAPAVRPQSVEIPRHASDAADRF